MTKIGAAAFTLRPHPEEPRSGVSKDGCVQPSLPSVETLREERAPQDEDSSTLWYGQITLRRMP